MTKLSQIEQKIKEVCPWLMELTFGCEVKYGKDSIKSGKIISKMVNGLYTVLNDKNTIRASIDVVDIVEVLGKEPQLSDLLYTIKSVNENNQEKGVYFDLGGSELLLMSRSPLKIENSVSYDLTKSIRENLENEELCDFIHQLICK